MENKITLPSFDELVSDNNDYRKDNALMVLLNQEPPLSWFEPHPMVKVKDTNGQLVPALYMPIGRTEWLLSRIYNRWWVEVKSIQQIANSVCVTVRLLVKNPITGDTDYQDGIGAVPIQTEAGASATDWSKVRSAAVQIAAPAAESYAVKDAAEKFGKIFGKDINRRVQIDYNNLLKPDLDESDLADLLEMKKESLTKKELADCIRIISTKETKSYHKLQNFLKSK